jgi:hypothetical protein
VSWLVYTYLSDLWSQSPSRKGADNRSTRISPRLSQDMTPRAPKSKPNQGVSSRSPSLTPPPPPPSVSQRLRSTSPFPSISPGLGKRKRDTASSDNSAGLINGADAVPSGQNGLANGEVSQNGKDAAPPIGDEPMEEAAQEDSPMPENIQGPDAEQAFLEAMDAFDEQDLAVPDTVDQDIAQVNGGEEVNESQGGPGNDQADVEMEDEELPAQAEQGQDEVNGNEESQGADGVDANGEESLQKKLVEELQGEDTAGE